MRMPIYQILVVALMAAMLTGCGATPVAPTATVAPKPTVTAAPATVTPAPAVPTVTATIAATPTLAGSPAVHPPAARTGVPEVDAVIQAFLGNDLGGRRSLVRYVTTPCTTAQGSGGPPKCGAGEANGTAVTVFPFLGSEGEFVRRDGIDRVLQFEVQGLYGVYRVPETVFRAPYWPAGQYAIVFVCKEDLPTVKGSRQQAVVYVEGGGVVRIARSPLRAAWPPDEAAGATWLLPPVGGTPKM